MWKNLNRYFGATFPMIRDLRRAWFKFQSKILIDVVLNSKSGKREQRPLDFFARFTKTWTLLLELGKATWNTFKKSKQLVRKEY